MKRKDIVTKLIKEGFSEKTLARMSDKDLLLMASRVLSEQAPMPVTNVSKTDIPTQTALKQQKKPFATYEGEIKEDDDKKSDVIKRLEYKIKHCKDEKKIADYKELLKKVKGGKVKPSGMEIDEEEKPKFKSKTEWLKSKGIIKDDDKKEETKETIAPASQPVSKPGEMGLDLTEWVNNVVGKNVHPFTSKHEILSLIKSKLNEQEVAEPPVKTKLPNFLTYDSITNAGAAEPAEPKTKPTTRPGTPEKDPRRKGNPYQPGPGINPAPKARKKE